MPSNEIKRLNTRFRRQSDVDLIERAAAKSGLPVSEWTRRALVKTAEEQVHKSGILMMTLKNILLIRRILEIAKIIPDDALNAAKDWARIQAEDSVRTANQDANGGGENG